MCRSLRTDAGRPAPRVRDGPSADPRAGVRRAIGYVPEHGTVYEGLTADEARIALLGEKQPSLQFTTPEQLGELAVFLCSPAADNVRGQAWAVDGGWTAQ